jgi:hypothetical protein
MCHFQHATALLIFRRTIFPGPLQNLQVVRPLCIVTRVTVPITSMLSCPLQHLKVTSFCCSTASPSTPRTPILTCPLQHIQPPCSSSFSTSSLIPLTAILPDPLQQRQGVASCSCTCVRPPRTLLPPQPLQYLQVATIGILPHSSQEWIYHVDHSTQWLPNTLSADPLL